MRLALGLLPALLMLAGCAPRPLDVAPPALDPGAPGWGATAARVLEAPVVGGNAVDVLVDGREIFPSMLAAIASARTSITYVQFVYKDGAISLAMAEAFAERCRAGVPVRILIDAWGADWVPDAAVDTLRAAGCRYSDAFRPLDLANLGRLNFRNHRRVLVVDGRVGFTGGSGVGAPWLSDGEKVWRETDVRVEGPVVRWLQDGFAELWREATGEVLAGPELYPEIEPAGTVDAQVVASSPIDGRLTMPRLFMLALASATRSVYITNQYLVLDEPLTRAMVEAAARGVDVVLLIPGVDANPLVAAAGRPGLGRLLEGGVEIYRYVAGPLHAKTMVVDGEWATIGSTNLDPRSLRINEELNLVVYDEAVAGEMVALFARDLARSRRLTAEEWARRAPAERFLEWLVAPLRPQV